MDTDRGKSGKFEYMAMETIQMKYKEEKTEIYWTEHQWALGQFPVT